MLIDWPEQKAELQDEFERAVRQATIAGAPIVAQVPHVIVNECHQVDFVYPDGSRTEMPLKEHQFSSQFHHEDVLRGGFTSIDRTIQDLGASMAKDMEAGLLDTIKNASPSTGGLLHGSSAEQIAEEFLNRLENMEFSFDEDGRPEVSIIVHPDVAAQLYELGEQQNELKRRAEAILERKRSEWLRRESHRRLAD
jgi:hypothetical protein